MGVDSSVVEIRDRITSTRKFLSYEDEYSWMMFLYFFLLQLNLHVNPSAYFRCSGVPNLSGERPFFFLPRGTAFSKLMHFRTDLQLTSFPTPLFFNEYINFLVSYLRVKRWPSLVLSMSSITIFFFVFSRRKFMYKRFVSDKIYVIMWSSRRKKKKKKEKNGVNLDD